MPTQKNPASWDLQLGFNLAFKRLNIMRRCINVTPLNLLQVTIINVTNLSPNCVAITTYLIVHIFVSSYTASNPWLTL